MMKQLNLRVTLQKPGEQFMIEHILKNVNSVFAHKEYLILLVFLMFAVRLAILTVLAYYFLAKRNSTAKKPSKFVLRWSSKAIYYLRPIFFFVVGLAWFFFLLYPIDYTTCDVLGNSPVDEPEVSPLKDSPQFSDAALLTIAALCYIVAGCALYYLVVIASNSPGG
jgi:hypothetical protein